MAGALRVLLIGLGLGYIFNIFTLFILVSIKLLTGPPSGFTLILVPDWLSILIYTGSVQLLNSLPDTPLDHPNHT